MTTFVGTDIGGTFTDVVVFDSATRDISFGKALTTYADLVEAVADGIVQASGSIPAIDILKHGTTQVINTLLERSGANAALITTAGFRDVLEVGRAGRPLPFDLHYSRSAPLVSRSQRYEVRERIGGDGSIVTPLDVDQLQALADAITEAGIEAVAVSFLNSFRNPVHEQLAVQLLREWLPQCYVTCGSDLSREWFEYERTSTAVANAYIGPSTERYIDRFESRLAADGFDGRFLVMASNGGVITPERARSEPVALVESGPIGGCIGAEAFARALGVKQMIAFDMGGTTAKCALVNDYTFELQPVYYVGGYEYGLPLRTPVLDIVEVGIGGGSIAHVDEFGQLGVGPRSARSEPGPACFGRGGLEATVTDANVALGRIGSGRFLNGALALDRDKAIEALTRNITQPLGYNDFAPAASGILSLANAKMATALREISVERGHDVRNFSLFAFGGGGPLHGVSLARELRIKQIIVPPEPGNFSAIGMLLADARADELHTYRAELDEALAPELSAKIGELQEAASRQLRIDFGVSSVEFEHQMELRLKGQRHSVKIRFEPENTVAEIVATFHQAYAATYGLSAEGRPIELIGLRVSSFAQTLQPALESFHRIRSGRRAEPASTRRVFHAEIQEWLSTPIFSRYDLQIGTRLQGPAVIEEFGSTTVIGPGERLSVGTFGEMVIDLQ